IGNIAMNLHMPEKPAVHRNELNADAVRVGLGVHLNILIPASRVESFNGALRIGCMERLARVERDQSVERRDFERLNRGIERDAGDGLSFHQSYLRRGCLRMRASGEAEHNYRYKLRGISALHQIHTIQWKRRGGAALR